MICGLRVDLRSFVPHKISDTFSDAVNLKIGIVLQLQLETFL